VWKERTNTVTCTGDFDGALFLKQDGAGLSRDTLISLSMSVVCSYFSHFSYDKHRNSSLAPLLMSDGQKYLKFKSKTLKKVQGFSMIMETGVSDHMIF
jgi:hypothetical protein